MLGIPYTFAIDMWSFGCILAELCSGIPLFPGESEREQMSLLLEVLDVPSSEVRGMSSYSDKFFEKTGYPHIMDDIKGEKKYAGSKPLADMIESDDPLFVDFLMKCLDWNPLERYDPD